MKSKVAAMILVSFMLSASLLSCGETKNPDVQTSPLESTSGGSDIETPNDFTYIDEYVASLAADHDFGGATFTVIGRSKAGFP